METQLEHMHMITQNVNVPALIHVVMEDYQHLNKITVVVATYYAMMEHFHINTQTVTVHVKIHVLMEQIHFLSIAAVER